jgi:hypothetical protein
MGTLKPANLRKTRVRGFSRSLRPNNQPAPHFNAPSELTSLPLSPADIKRRSCPVKKVFFIGGLVGASCVKDLCAQDALRFSQAGEEAAATRAQAQETPGYYNFRWGDLQVRAESNLSVEGDDNVDLVSTNKVADVIIQPSLSTQLTYPISQKNSLNLNVAVGYAAHVRQSYLDQFFVTPGTELAFDVYIKDFVIEIHDWLSLTDESYDNPAAASEANYSYIENTAGLRGLWELDQLHLAATYDHLILESLNAADNQENSSQDLFTLRAGADLNSISELGAEASAAMVSYDQNVLNGGVQYTAGLYYHVRFSPNLSLRATAGYLVYNLDNAAGPSTNYQSQVSTFYGSVSLQHRVNEHLDYNLEIGHGVNAGLFSDTLDMYYARLTTDLNIVRNWRLKLLFSYENGSETGGLGESFDRYGVGGSISRSLTKKLTASLNYNFWDRFSDLPDRTYTENQVLLNLTYNF